MWGRYWGRFWGSRYWNKSGGTVATPFGTRIDLRRQNARIDLRRGE